MTTVEILSVSDADGGKFYRATSGDKHSTGQTAGQALDALTVQLGESEFSGLLIIRQTVPDQFFTLEQQERLSHLMSLWRQARDQDRELLPEQQAELDLLIEAELQASIARTEALIQ